ncbi:MAG: hypothetical protein AB7V00_01875 [Bacilli bacterium]
MFKLMLIVSSFMSLFSSSKQSFEVFVNPDESDGVIDQSGDFIVVQKATEVVLKHVSENWEIIIPQFDTMKIRTVNNKAMFVYQIDGYLKVIEVDKIGTINYAGTLIPNRLGNNWDIKLAEQIFICGTIEHYEDNNFIKEKNNRLLSKNDALVVCLDYNYQITNWKIFGGQENEGFECLTIANNKIFIAGKKDPYSGGDFGNGGLLKDNNFVCSLDLNLNLLHFFIFNNNSDILLIDYVEESLFVCTTAGLYKMSDVLTIINKRLFEMNIFFGLVTCFNSLIAFEMEKAIIIDLLDMQIKSSIFIEQINEDTKYFLMEKALKIANGPNSSYFEVMDLRNFSFPKIYYNNNAHEGYIKGIFELVEITQKIASPQFNPLVFGEYQWTILLKNSYNLQFELKKSMFVQREVNVSDNLIYPLGYTLHFTGTATLNGKQIVNNYPINQSGSYNLLLTGLNDEQHSICFFVEKEQIHFQELKERNWHFETRRGGVIQIDFSLIGNWERIDYVVINNEKYYDIIFDQINNRLNIRFDAPNEGGLYYYQLESIHFHQGDNLLSYPINEMFVVNVLGFAPEVIIEETNDFEYIINVDDEDCCARFFSVQAISNIDDCSLHFPLADANIGFSNLNQQQNYDITIYLHYDTGNKQIDTIELLRIKATGNDLEKLGEILILEKTTTLKKLSLSLEQSEKNILEIVANNHFVYQKPVTNILSSIFIGALCFPITFCIVWGAKSIIKKQKKQIF